MLSAFASNLDTEQRKHLKNCVRPMEIVFCREHGFLGGLMNFQKEENQLKESLAAEGLHLQGIIHKEFVTQGQTINQQFY